MAKTPDTKILTDAMKYKKFKKEYPEFKMPEKKHTASERGKKKLLGPQKEQKTITESKENENKKNRGHPRRSLIARLSGLSEEQVRRLEFIDRYAPEVLATARDKKVSEIYNPVWEWYQTVKKEDTELLRKVVKGEIKLKAAYEKLLKRKPSIKLVAKESPYIKVLKEGRAVIEEWIKKQHEGQYKPTADELKLIHAMDALIRKYAKK